MNEDGCLGVEVCPQEAKNFELLILPFGFRLTGHPVNKPLVIPVLDTGDCEESLS